MSPETAAALAEGGPRPVRRHRGVGLTGVAGPDPVDGQGPGRVYLGVSGGRRPEVHCLDLAGDRAEVCGGAVAAAMEILLSGLR